MVCRGRGEEEWGGGRWRGKERLVWCGVVWWDGRRGERRGGGAGGEGCVRVHVRAWEKGGEVDFQKWREIVTCPRDKCMSAGKINQVSDIVHMLWMYL